MVPECGCYKSTCSRVSRGKMLTIYSFASHHRHIDMTPVPVTLKNTKCAFATILKYNVGLTLRATG